jgi:hypothetical protein
MGRIRSPLQSPLLHCLVLGFFATGLLPGAEPVPAANPDSLLYGEALRRDLDRLPIVRERLVKLADFLELTDPDASESERLRAARAMGLDRSDPVIRRVLVEAAREQLATEVNVEPPSLEELEAQVPAWEIRRVRISHAFVGFGERARSQALVESLLADPPDLEDAIARGDVFYGGHHLPPLSHREVAARFGESFADAVMIEGAGAVPTPVSSSYGHHAVWIHEVVEDTVDDRVERVARSRRAIVRERTRRAVERKIASLEAAS